MKLIDHAKIYIRSGRGGNGCVGFRREKFIEFGGPDGGDGGRGGHVWATAVDGLNTLIDFRYRPHIVAGHGGHGAGQKRTGHSGRDAVICVPLGTRILNADHSAVIADLTETEKPVLLARGGRGGFGNARFAHSTRQTPRFAQIGGDGIEATVWLRLKLMADVGLVGLPNAGKSTCLTVISKARPKVADYPFTTLHPHLGVICNDHRSVVVADIPGLIAGAHRGCGIGDRFLGHIERCCLLVHMVDATSPTCVDDYHSVDKELILYGQGVDKKPRIVVLSKADAVPETIVAEQKAILQAAVPYPVLVFSAHIGLGRTALLQALVQGVDTHRPLASARSLKPASSAERKQWSPI